MHICKNVRTCEQVMEHGWKNRSTGATLMNADSSRSHSIFTIHMERAEADAKGEDHIRVAKLNLVDLAGSERQGKTGKFPKQSTCTDFWGISVVAPAARHVRYLEAFNVK